MNRDHKIKLIQDAMTYRSGNDSCNSVYMGSMALAELYRLIGATYGKKGFDEELNAAPDNVLNAAIAYCKPYLEAMHKHPTMKCPTCGGIMLAQPQPSPEAER